MSYPLRPIRSFMLRAGRMSNTSRQGIDTQWSQFVLNPESTIIDFDTVFKRSAPRILEIGFGMGHSLLQQAQQQPEFDFIGIEVHRPGIGTLLAGLAANNVTNVRLFCADAIAILTHCIATASLHKVQLFFPDPWPKRRHHKRRLVQAEFVELIYQKLQTQGIFHLATDWENYAQQMLQVLTAHSGFSNSAGAGNFATRPSARPLTKFELRAQQSKRLVWDLLFSKDSH